MTTAAASAVEPPAVRAQAPMENQVPAVGLARRSWALMAIGYPLAEQAAALGISERSLRRFAGQVRVPCRHWAAMADLYERWSTRPGPSARARDIARVKKWAAPIAWEGLDIDDPSIRPWRCPPRDTQLVDLIAVSRALRGDRSVELTRAERRAAYTVAVTKGMTAHQLAAALGLSVETADRGLNRARVRVRNGEVRPLSASAGESPWITSVTAAQ